MNKSALKTKMRNSGFRCSPTGWYSVSWDDDDNKITRYKIHRCAWRKHWEYCKAHGRNFRVRWNDGFVDVSEPYQAFDRWANSIEKTLTIEQFAKEFLK